MQREGLGRQGVSTDSALGECGTGSPETLQGQSLAFRLSFFSYFVFTLFMVYELFP